MITSEGFVFDPNMLRDGPHGSDMDLAEAIYKKARGPFALIGLVDPVANVLAALTLGIQVALANVNNPPVVPEEQENEGDAEGEEPPEPEEEPEAKLYALAA